MTVITPPLKTTMEKNAVSDALHLLTTNTQQGFPNTESESFDRTTEDIVKRLVQLRMSRMGNPI